MKKIINGFLIGIGIVAGTVLALAALVTYSKKEEVVGIERSVAIQRANSSEDCWISGDGKTFYINEDRNYDGEVDTVIGYKIID